ncbi:hypothetical protein ABRZ08_13245 [Castellaniella ginsengisoli]|uniref:Uncharacterized protein n=1 Tax=Castellaniella ginsengisoli TaxID=546114 RepID=A0AB39G347_9BURK
MANVDFFSAFEYAWGENGAIDTWIDTQYKLGWASIGSVPPSVEQFNAVHHIADLKANWLYGQLKTAATAKGVTLAAEDLSALVQILAATAPDASSTKKGLIEIATEAEAKALASTLLAITPATLAAVLADFQSGIPGATFAELDAATADQGPAICTDMGCMPWVWTNTAYFTGYRNPLCATIPQHFAATARAWEMPVTGGVWSESDPKQRRLIAWFREQGLTVASGSWAKGWGRIADLGGGDWKAPDLQDVFLRMAGTDADTANPRPPGSYQADAARVAAQVRMKNDSAPWNAYSWASKSALAAGYPSSPADSYFGLGGNIGNVEATVMIGGSETRAASVAVQPVILV